MYILVSTFMVQRVVRSGEDFHSCIHGGEMLSKKISSGAAVVSVPGRFLLRWAAKGLFFVF